MDETGNGLTPSHTQRSGRRVRYEVSNRLISGGGKDGLRLPAPTFEGAVATIIADHICRLARTHQVLRESSAAQIARVSKAAEQLGGRVGEEGIRLAAGLIERTKIASAAVEVKLSSKAVSELLNVSHERLTDHVIQFDAPFTCKRRSVDSQN
ncbi:MAG: hypothetical protein AAFP13_04695 [Pseudomonadota bacterium]